MKKTCVFKCQFDETWYRVYVCVHPDNRQKTYYQTYVGRKRLDHSTWPSLGAAIGSIINRLGYDVINDLMRIWS